MNKKRVSPLKKRLKLNIELYKKIFLIRKSEEKIIENYGDDDMKTPMHMSKGEEAITAGVCQALEAKDQVYGTYRSHALYLSKTGETDKFFAEMYGKVTGVVKGKGGSMHLSAPEYGFMGTSAVVASNIPVAVGTAFANKYKNNKKVVVVFFGDGAIDEGVFWESINFACLWKLPVIFVCEDNGLAVHTNLKTRQGFKFINKTLKCFNCKVFDLKTTDPEKVYAISKKAIQLSRTTFLPVFIHLYYYRYLEHVGVNEDFKAGYRPKSEYYKWLKIDPLSSERKKLIRLGLRDDQIKIIENEIETKVESSLVKAKKDPFAKREELYKDVFYES